MKRLLLLFLCAVPFAHAAPDIDLWAVYGKARPSAANTGCRIAEGSLTVRTTTMRVTTDNAVISGYYFDKADLVIEAANVTVEDCVFNGRCEENYIDFGVGGGPFYLIDTRPGTNTLIQHCTITNGRSANIYLANATVQYCEIYRSYGDLVKPTSNVVFQHNWLHHTGSAAGAHGDGLQWKGGSNCVVRWNRIDLNRATLADRQLVLNYNGSNYTITYANSQCIIGSASDSGDPLYNIDIYENEFWGGGNAVNVGGTPDAGPNVNIYRNGFRASTSAVAALTGDNTASNLWTCNFWINDGTVQAGGGGGAVTAGDLVAGQDASSDCGLEGGSDVTAPVISGASATPASTTATIVATADELADWLIEWGTAAVTENQATISGTTSLNYEITGLTASTAYLCRVTATDSSSNASAPTSVNFSTAASGSDQAAPPTIDPAGGLFSSAVTVTLSKTTGGAIQYSTNGTDFVAYTAPLLITETVTLYAKVAAGDGFLESDVVSKTFTIASGSGVTITSAGYGVIPLSATFTAAFTAEYTVTPGQSLTNLVTGLSDEDDVSGFGDLACIVRFYTTGVVDARNGGSYAAANVLNYSAGTAYRVRIVVTFDAGGNTYSAYVTPAGGGEVQIANGYAFRTEQAGATSLNKLAASIDGNTNANDTAAIGEMSAYLNTPPVRAVASPNSLGVQP